MLQRRRDSGEPPIRYLTTVVDADFRELGIIFRERAQTGVLQANQPIRIENCEARCCCAEPRDALIPDRRVAEVHAC